jgi:3'-phosphoadenosine 5'-phosphosulfate sulfotransferase (PAPS reductase)/FAD synthetase
VPVIFLDTGYHFAETIGTREAIESVYDIRLLEKPLTHPRAGWSSQWMVTVVREL